MVKRVARKMAQYCPHPVKKVVFGAFVFLVGFLWYLVETGVLIIAQYWPKVLMLLGALMMLKGIWISTKG